MLRRLLIMLVCVGGLLAISAPAYAYTGVASWYDLPGNYTASGDVLSSYDHTCASNVYPFGTYLDITYNGVTVQCVVTDTGGFSYLGRDVDLNYGVASELPGFLYSGVGYVDIEYAGYDPGWYYYKQYS